MARNETKRSAASAGSSSAADPSPVADERDASLFEGQLAFDLIKGNLFRTVSADGVFGGVSPTGRAIHATFFSERAPIPTRVVHKVENGSLGEELTEFRESKPGIVREMECDIVMDLITAESVYEWLGGRINELRLNLVARGIIKAE